MRVFIALEVHEEWGSEYLGVFTTPSAAQARCTERVWVPFMAPKVRLAWRLRSSQEQEGRDALVAQHPDRDVCWFEVLEEELR